MRLRDALNIRRGDVIAFTGAGGKSTALFRLGRELANEGWRVIGTTTTYVTVNQLSDIPGVLKIGGELRREAISRTLNEHGFVFLYSHVAGDKAMGISPDTITALTDNVDSDVILIEADKSGGMSFKAPYALEPAIPDGVSLVVPIVGFDVLGEPLDDLHVYNPDAMIARYGFVAGTRVKGPWLASVIRDDQLGLKGIPHAARIIGLINKVPSTSYPKGRARLIARLMLLEPRIHSVAIGAMLSGRPIFEVQKRIGAVVLAGGLSSRMGQSKVLLPWDNRPIIQVIVDRLKRTHLDDIVVVTGHLPSQVAAALAHEPARVVHNSDYREGDMLSSLQAGIRALGPEISACMIVLGDQPQIDPRVISDVMNAYAEGRGSIIAPSYKHRRGHPIIVDRMYWPELLNLEFGAAARDVINAHAESIAYVNVSTDSILRDIDTPQDYREERRRAGLS